RFFPQRYGRFRMFSEGHTLPAPLRPVNMDKHRGSPSKLRRPTPATSIFLAEVVNGMPKPLPSSDFRAIRIVLERDDFAYAPGPELPPSDLVDENTWRGITTLPDDVSIRASNHYGT